jgi:hypothetical protein
LFAFLILSHGRRQLLWFEVTRHPTVEPDEQSTVSPTQMRSRWRTLPKNVELMPQHQDLRLQLLSRLEAVAQHADE